MNRLRTSLIIASVVAATVLGSFMGRRPLLQGAIGNSPPGINVSRPVASAETRSPDAASTICKPGYVPPSCLAMRFDKTGDLTFRGNGARPAVAKDTLPGYSGIHDAAFVNDGLYGHGASWISNSPYSWIKIDLGQATTINTVTFGRDRLGNFNDRDPGQFVIAVATSDDIYADGNSSNDGIEYIQVYDSKGAGFTGTVSGAETVTAQFGSVVARYVKITFENPGTAIDEVEVFMVQPVFAIGEPTDRPDSRPLRPTSTPVPSNTPRPTSTYTLTPTNTPTDTPVPTSTPTNTPIPTNTPTNTPVPTHTPSNTPVPTNTPAPTNTPQPTATASPVPTSTPRPPNTPTPVPSDTPVAQATP